MMYATLVVAIIAIVLFAFWARVANAGIYNGISFDHEFEGVKIQTSYRSDYGESMWQITDNKELFIALEILEQPENTTVMIEHMHADISIHSYKEEVDGLTQDSMDDKMHTGTQEGFYVSPEHPYFETFAVEGYSKFLIEGWGFLIGYYGWTSIEEKRLTEANLKKAGAQGSEVVTIFDVLIRHDGEDYFHKRIIVDDFYIFFDGGFEESSGHEESKELERIWWMDDWALTALLIGGVAFIGGFIYAFKNTKIGLVAVCIGLIIMAIALWAGLHSEEIEVILNVIGNQ